MASADDAKAVVELINRAHGAALTLVERASGGESLPWVVADPSGVRHLLKWSDGEEFRIEQAVTINERLRQRGYPIPPYLLTGRHGRIGYAVRALVPGRSLGAPMQPIDARYLPQLLELNDLQAGAASGVPSNWQARIRQSVLAGFGDWCVLDSFRTYSDETAAMLVALQALVRDCDISTRPTSDVVHGDFNGPNILIEGDRISAVIDWENAEPGDRAFDIVNLLFYDYLNPPVHEVVSGRLKEIASRESVAVYLAHMIVRQVEWSISHHPTPVVDHYLAIAREILRDLRR